MTTLTSLERTEERWAKRGLNPIARYLNWASLNHPWMWRARLDLVLLINAIAAVLAVVTILSAPSNLEPYDGTRTMVTVVLMAVAILVPLAGGFYWIYAVTKSVRARAMPKLGRRPGMITTIVILFTFLMWTPALMTASYLTTWHDPATGQAWYVPSEEPATEVAEVPAEAPADPAAAPAEAPPVEERTLEDIAREREELRAQNAYLDEIRSRLIRPSLARALFDRPVDYLWTDGTAFTELREHARTTDPWSQRPELFAFWRGDNALMLEPRLVESFQRSDRYRLMHARAYGAMLNYADWTEHSPAAREILATIQPRIATALQYRLPDPNYDRFSETDPLLLAYWDAFQTYLLSNDNYYVQYSPLVDSFNSSYGGAGTVEASYALLWQFESQPDLHREFMRSGSFVGFARTQMTVLGLQDPRAIGEIAATQGFDDYIRGVERAADPRAGLTADNLRSTLIGLPIQSMGVALALVAVLATFVTGLNWGGLGVTLGSAVLAAVVTVILFIIAATTSSLSGYDPITGNSRIPIGITMIAAGIVSVLLPLAFVIKDLIGGILARSSRLAALTTIWAGGFCIPIGALALWTWIQAFPIWPNDLLAVLVLMLTCTVLFGLYASLIHLLIARIATYPQPG